MPGTWIINDLTRIDILFWVLPTAQEDSWLPPSDTSRGSFLHFSQTIIMIESREIRDSPQHFCTHTAPVNPNLIFRKSHLPFAWKPSKPILGASVSPPHLVLAVQPTTALLHFSFVLIISQIPVPSQISTRQEVNDLRPVVGTAMTTGASNPVG